MNANIFTPANISLSGLIISLSILIAAGLAVYDNPQVREWIDESRRKIALALHNIGDEMQPRRPSISRNSSNDASTREDESGDAAERRRLARQQIMERARVLEEKRKEKVAQRGHSFDNMVDQEGKLKEKEPLAEASATGTEVEGGELRKRQAGAAAVALGSLLANPFADEAPVDFSDEKAAFEGRGDIQAERSPRLDATSTKESDFQDVTPSASTPVSSSPTDRLSDAPETQRPSQSVDFHSIQEWTERSTASFYSPPESERHFHEPETVSAAASTTASIIGSADYLSEAELISERGDMMDTPDTWTEVGSVVSEENP